MIASTWTQICMLDYAPGEKLREEDLAKELGVSPTPVPVSTPEQKQARTPA